MTRKEPAMTESAHVKGRTIWLLIAWLVASLLAGVVGTMLGGPMPDPWYEALAKPAFNPPGWVFGPVWTTLYILMGIAAWRVSLAPRSPLRRTALILFVAQLALNAAWSGIFFGLHEIGWALAELAVLWVFIVATVILFARIGKLPAALLLPYLAWVTFAGVLNVRLWQLNA
jgi:tryptophan-rich sensory protein